MADRNEILMNFQVSHAVAYEACGFVVVFN